MRRERDAIRRDRGAHRSAHQPAQTSPPSLRVSPTVVAIALLVVAHALFFRAVLFQGRSFVSPDTIQVASPAQEYAQRYRAHHGASPQWVPHVFSGMPARGSMLVLPSYPPYVLLRGLLGDAFGSDEAKVFHHLLAAVWTFVLVRMWGGGIPGAWLAAIGFSFATSLVSVTAADHGGKLFTTSYLPLLLIVATKLLQKPGLFVTGAGGVVVGLMLRACHPQIAYYGLLAFGLLLLWASPEVWRRGRGRELLRVMVSAATVIAIGWLISAPLTLPAQEYAPHSIRGASPAGGLDYDYATQWSFHPSESVTFLIPGFFGFGGATYWGRMPFTDAPHYGGVILVALAVMGAASTLRTTRGRFLVSMMALALLVGMGKHSVLLYDLFFRFLPQFNRFRVPVLILVLFQLGMCVLAGIGLGTLAAGDRGRRRRWGWALIVAAAVVFLLGLVGAGSARHTQRPNEERLSPQTRAAVADERAAMARNDGIRSAVFLAIPGILLLATGRRNGTARAAVLIGMGCALLGAIDLWSVSSRIVHPTYRKADLARALEATPGERWLAARKEWGRVLPLGDRANSNRFMVFDVQSVMGYYPAKLARYARLIESGCLQSLPVLRMLGTRYVLSPQPLQSPVLTSVGAFGSDHLYALPDPLPKAWCVPRWELAQGDDMLQRISAPAFSPESLAVLAADPGIAQNGRGRVIAIRQDRPERLEVDVSVERDVLLIISDMYYPPGWKVKVDGTAGSILVANQVLCAVPLRAGARTVEFFYASSAERAADRLAVAGWVCAIGLLGGAVLRREIRMPPRGGWWKSASPSSPGSGEPASRMARR